VARSKLRFKRQIIGFDGRRVFLNQRQRGRKEEREQRNSAEHLRLHVYFPCSVVTDCQQYNRRLFTPSLFYPVFKRPIAQLFAKQFIVNEIEGNSCAQQEESPALLRKVSRELVLKRFQQVASRVEQQGPIFVSRADNAFKKAHSFQGSLPIASCGFRDNW